ncbi:MAG: hypothetical protein AB7V44_19265, partial [Pseudonocardia sp.]
ALQILLADPGPVVRPPLHLQVEYGPDEEDLDGLRGEVERALRDQLVVPARVDLVPPGALPRWEMKAKLIKRRWRASEHRSER